VAFAENYIAPNEYYIAGGELEFTGGKGHAEGTYPTYGDGKCFVPEAFAATKREIEEIAAGYGTPVFWMHKRGHTALPFCIPTVKKLRFGQPLCLAAQRMKQDSDRLAGKIVRDLSRGESALRRVFGPDFPADVDLPLSMARSYARTVAQVLLGGICPDGALIPPALRHLEAIAWNNLQGGKR
jgi:hypothetical protein